MENQVLSAEGNGNSSQVQEAIVEKISSDTGSATIPGRDNERKIFVGGLTGETTEKELTDYFSKFGAIESANIKVDHNTGNSKGFGFIVFNAVDAVNKVTAAGNHVINNKKIDAQIAKVRNGKIFVGGITNEMTDEDIKTYFGQFGQVIGVELPFDKTRNQRKNFCFVIFQSEEVAKKVLQNPKQIIKNKEVDVKRPMVKGGVSSQRNSDGYGQNWDQPQGSQAYGGYGFNQPSYGSVYGGYDGSYHSYGTYGAAGYDNYGNGDQNSSYRNNSGAADRGSNRGGSRGAGRGMNRGRGAPRGRGGLNRFQPY